MRKKLLYTLPLTLAFTFSSFIFTDSNDVTVYASEQQETLQVDKVGDTPISTEIIPYSKEHRPMRQMKPQYITIHNTDNEDYGATAEMHSNYLNYSAKDAVSWHFTVDNKEIIQHLPLNEIGYHAGDGSNGEGNLYSIAIEICENVDGNYAQAEKNAAKLVAEILYEFDMDISQVVKHQHWSGKECPRNMINKTKGSLGWEGFLDQVEKELTSIILKNAKTQENNETMTLKVGQSSRLAIYSKTTNEEYELHKDGYQLISQTKNEDNKTHKIAAAVNNKFNYTQAILLSSSNYSVDNSIEEFKSLLTNNDALLEIIGDIIVDKDSRTYINPGIAQLTFTSEKGKASFYVYNYVKENPIITTNVEAFLKLGSAMDLIMDIETPVEWQVGNTDIAEIKDGMLVGKKEGETIIYAKFGNINISRKLSVNK